jgi:hypothetical protein
MSKPQVHIQIKNIYYSFSSCRLFIQMYLCLHIIQIVFVVCTIMTCPLLSCSVFSEASCKFLLCKLQLPLGLSIFTTTCAFRHISPHEQCLECVVLQCHAPIYCKQPLQNSVPSCTAECLYSAITMA